MPELPVETLCFTFPSDWQASKYDDWSFYRHRFQRIRNEVKAIDILAIAPDRTTWFIEVKDYRRHQRTKPIDLASEVAHSGVGRDDPQAARRRTPKVDVTIPLIVYPRLICPRTPPGARL